MPFIIVSAAVCAAWSFALPDASASACKLASASLLPCPSRSHPLLSMAAASVCVPLRTRWRVRVRTIFARKRTMQSAANLALPLVGALVRHAEHRTGSRMLAYDAVARSIGATGSWVRKFIGHQPVRLDADTFLRIHRTYQANCDRWDAQADEDRAAFFALGVGDDAMDQGADKGLDVESRAASSHGWKTDPVVAPLVDKVGK